MVDSAVHCIHLYCPASDSHASLPASPTLNALRPLCSRHLPTPSRHAQQTRPSVQINPQTPSPHGLALSDSPAAGPVTSSHMVRLRYIPSGIIASVIHVFLRVIHSLPSFSHFSLVSFFLLHLLPSPRPPLLLHPGCSLGTLFGFLPVLFLFLTLTSFCASLPYFFLGNTAGKNYPALRSDPSL